MSRRAWDLIKHSKRFYVRSYRKSGSLLLVSIVLNAFLGLAIWYFYNRLPEPDFYATYGETPPVLLTAMEMPNYSSVPLLATSPNQDSDARTIPQ
ncbi:MAG: type IVB secretion system protein IcmM/DotJ [Legionellaceae bacterium]|nr:type IVB secretion system protein IcmM/DotJ [Legionellaceae bacterium]